MDDPLTAPLSPADAALVRFAEVLTHRPAAVTEADLDTLAQLRPGQAVRFTLAAGAA